MADGVMIGNGAIRVDDVAIRRRWRRTGRRRIWKEASGADGFRIVVEKKTVVKVMARYRQVDPSHLLPPDPNLKVEKKQFF